MRPFMFGVLITAVLVFFDYYTTGGFYTGKFTEMSGKIADGFRRY